MSEEKKALMCRGCAKKKAKPNRRCDGEGCGRVGCQHFITGDGKKDLCGGCKSKARAAARRAAK